MTITMWKRPPRPFKEPKMKMTHEQRMRQHQHNQHKGSVAMAIANMTNIISSPSVTAFCASMAANALHHLKQVQIALVNRVNTDGSTSHLKWNDPKINDGDQ